MQPEALGSKVTTARGVLLPGLFIAAFCLLAFEFFGPLRIARDWVADLRLASLTPVFPQSEDILVLTVTEETLARFPYRAPVNRDFLADILDTLSASGEVRTLGIDLLFDQPTVAIQDERLRRALLDAPFPVVVAVGEVQAGLTSAQYTFQSRYLEGIRTGSAILRSQDGVVRNYWPSSPGGQQGTFSRVLGEAAGLSPPGDRQPVLFLKSADDGVAPIRMFPAHTLALLPSDWLKGKIVLLGSALPHQDRHRTPLSVLGEDYETIPGVLIHAQMLAQMTSGQAAPATGLFALVVTVLAASLAGLAAPLLPISPGRRLALSIALVPLYWLAVFNRPVFWHLPLPVLEPVAAYILIAAYTLARDRQRQRRQKRFLHDALVHYVAKPVVDDLVAHPEKLCLGGEKREMSFLFTDVAEFASLAEVLQPEQLVGLMTRYLEGLMEVTLRRGGTIGRLTGDGLLVFFGAPDVQRDHPRRAVDCALDMDRYCEKFRAAQALQNVDFGVTRIGVHTGAAVVGNVGGSNRFEYTAYGDSINIASRLEGLNQHLGTRVCISGACLAEHPPELFRPVGRVRLKGKTEALDVFTFWDTLSEPEQRACRELFETMWLAGASVEQDVAELAARLPGDTLTAYQLARLRIGESPVNIVMKEK